MATVKWPDSDQPRNRLLQAGPDRLTDAELLAAPSGMVGPRWPTLARC